MNFRSTLNEQNYKEMTATLAYKVVATTLKTKLKMVRLKFLSTYHYKKPVAFEPSNSFETE